MEKENLVDIKGLWRRIRAEQASFLVKHCQPYSGTGRLARINRGTRFAAAAWDQAKTYAQFEQAESLGKVRLKVIPDEYACLDDLFGDTYDPTVNSNVKPHVIARERQREIDRINSDGVWGLVGQYFDGRDWVDADSCFGFVGDDYKGSGYDLDIMSEALDQASKVHCCNACGRPSLQ